MATQTATTTIITPRTRNLGYGWSHTPTTVRPRPGIEHYTIVGPTVPSTVGSLRDVEADRESARRGNDTAEWVERLFVNGQPVVLARIVQEARPETGSSYVPQFEVTRDGRASVPAILHALRAGAHVELTTETAE